MTNSIRGLKYLFIACLSIVDYRNKNGAFKSVDELLKVSGIGEKLLIQNRSNIVLGGAEAAKK